MVITTTVDSGTPTVYTFNFQYDASGTPMSVVINGSEKLYYVTNLQGDVVALLNEAGNEVAEYTYSAYGEVSSQFYVNSTNSLVGAMFNPLQYRGYVHDIETGWYYLQSRYYDPEVGRFINADIYASTGQGLVGNNMFAYCDNNPTNKYDPTGCAGLPFPTLQDYYWMHKYVQYDIVERYGFGMEVWVIGSEGVGRLDIYDGETNSYYEVKHKGANSGLRFVLQMQKYVVSHVSGWRFKEYSIIGNVTKGCAEISGYTQYLYWDISYETEEDGVITYNWVLNESRYQKYLATTAIVASVVIMGFAYRMVRGVPGDVCKVFKD